MKHKCVLLFDIPRKYRGTPCEVGCNTVGTINSSVEGKHQPFHSVLSIIFGFGVNGTSPATTLIATNISPMRQWALHSFPFKWAIFAKHHFHSSRFHERCHLKQIQGIRHYSPLHMLSLKQILACCLLFLHFLPFSPIVECSILSCLLQF